jgi:hypothetical protein
MTPYFERSGLLQVDGIFQADTDAFPAAQYPFLPFISLELVEAVPEPSSWAMILAGAALLLMAKRARKTTTASV